MTVPTLLSIKQLIEKHQVFTLGGVKRWIFDMHGNGLFETGAIIRIGRKIVVDEELFFSWVKEQNGGAS